LRLAKSVKLQRVTLQGTMDVFNILNNRNARAASYTRNYFSNTYLRPSAPPASELFYFPRQIQFGFRVSF